MRPGSWFVVASLVRRHSNAARRQHHRSWAVFFDNDCSGPMETLSWELGVARVSLLLVKETCRASPQVQCRRLLFLIRSDGLQVCRQSLQAAGTLLGFMAAKGQGRQAGQCRCDSPMHFRGYCATNPGGTNEDDDAECRGVPKSMRSPRRAALQPPRPKPRQLPCPQNVTGSLAAREWGLRN